MSSLHAAGSTREWRKIRLAVLKRDKYKCKYCGGKADTVDHVKPRADGGGDSNRNLVASCMECNLHKGSDKLKRGGGAHQEETATLREVGLEEMAVQFPRGVTLLTHKARELVGGMARLGVGKYGEAHDTVPDVDGKRTGDVPSGVDWKDGEVVKIMTNIHSGNQEWANAKVINDRVSGETEAGLILPRSFIRLDGKVYMAMEHGGVTLESIHKATPALVTALEGLQTTLAGLQKVGITHGDVHFNNVVYDAATGRARFIDFGLAIIVKRDTDATAGFLDDDDEPTYVDEMPEAKARLDMRRLRWFIESARYAVLKDEARWYPYGFDIRGATKDSELKKKWVQWEVEDSQRVVDGARAVTFEDFLNYKPPDAGSDNEMDALMAGHAAALAAADGAGAGAAGHAGQRRKRAATMSGAQGAAGDTADGNPPPAKRGKGKRKRVEIEDEDDDVQEVAETGVAHAQAAGGLHDGMVVDMTEDIDHYEPLAPVVEFLGLSETQELFVRWLNIKGKHLNIGYSDDKGALNRFTGEGGQYPPASIKDGVWSNTAHYFAIFQTREGRQVMDSWSAKLQKYFNASFCQTVALILWANNGTHPDLYQDQFVANTQKIARMWIKALSGMKKWSDKTLKVNSIDITYDAMMEVLRKVAEDEEIATMVAKA